MAERRPTTVIGGNSPGQRNPPAGTMQAFVQDGYGTSDILRLAQVTRPEIGPRDVLVAVRAAGLDRGTWHLMQGKPRLLRLAFGPADAQAADHRPRRRRHRRRDRLEGHGVLHR